MYLKLLVIIISILLTVGCSRHGKPDTALLPATPAPEHVASPPEDASKSRADYEYADMAEAPRGYVHSGGGVKAPVPTQSGLKAGFADDNLQFNNYLEFLEKYKNVPQVNFPVNERIIIKVLDKDGNGLPGARVTIMGAGAVLAEATSYADGRTLMFPSEYPQTDSYEISISYGKMSKNFRVDRAGERTREFMLPVSRTQHNKVPVDILFVLDTTGSMGEEIQRLKSTLLIIHENLTSMNTPLDIRFGMVMYKDRGDEYVTKTIKFTDNAESFQKDISRIRAFGGGDTPEDMQKALEIAVTDMNWRDEGVRLVYLITDASAHLDYGEAFTLLNAAQEARKKGIKIFSVGTGGLDIEGEINLRQVAQYTMGKYIFLTYGERGESGGGAPGSVSHHTGANFTTDKLEAIIIRFTKEEIGRFTLNPPDEGEDYFEAAKGGHDSIRVLNELFGSMVSQLVNYSTVAVTKDTAVAVIPLMSSEGLAADAEYFTEHLYHAAAEYKGWKSVERKNLQKILDEITFSLSGLADETDMAEFGQLTGAKLLVTGSVYEKNEAYEIYLKLLRTETGEVLSVTRAKVERSLGLK